MRIRITFAKTEAMRYTSHLDLHRAWERTIRRANLPLAYSQGFRPHPRINLGAALPLGFTSRAEVIDIWLEECLPLGQIHQQLITATPPGIQIISEEEITPEAPTLQSQIIASNYLVTMIDPIPNLEVNIRHIQQSTSLPRERRGKTYDLRPLIHEICRLSDDEYGYQQLQLVLSAREGAAGRPEEVILALGGVPILARVHRSALIFTV